MAEAQSWDELVQQSAPKKPAGPASWDDLVAESAKDPGYLGEIGRGLKAGAQVQLPKMAGQALKFFGAEETGDSLIKGAEARDTPDLQESAAGQAEKSPFSVRGSVYEAASNAVPSLAPGAAGAAVGAAVGSVVPGLGTAAGALIGYAAGSIASLPMFYGSQAQESYESVKKTQLEAGKSEAEANAIATRTAHAEGAIEAGGELAADIIPFAKLFKPLARPAGKAAGSLVKDTLFPTFKQGAITTAQTVGGEVSTEMAQQAGEDYVRKEMGDTGPGATWDETAKVIMPTALMSLIPGAGGAAAVHLQRKGAVATLINPEADPETRSKVALGVAGALEPVDANLSRAFAGYAAEQIKAGKPIEIGPDAVYTAKAQPVLALPAPVVAGQSGESIEAQSARQAAIDAAETNAAKIYAERAEVEATQRVLGAGSIDDAIQAADQGAAFEADIADSVSLGLVKNQIGKAVTTAGRLADEQAARDRDFNAMQAQRRDEEAQAAIAESERRDSDGPARTAMQVAFEKATLKALEARERAQAAAGATPGGQPAAQSAEAPAEVKLFGKPLADLNDQELAAAAQNHPMSGFRHAAEAERARRAALAPAAVQMQATPAPAVANAAPAQPQTAVTPPPATPSSTATAVPPAPTLPVELPSTPPIAPQQPAKPVLIFGRTVDKLTQKELDLSAKKARTAAQREAAAAEIERRADEKQARPLSPAEETRRAGLRQQAAQRKRIDVDRDSLVQAVIKLGGLSPKERQDVTGDTKGDNPAVMGVGYLFSSTGTGSDDMATRLGQYGYLSQAELDDVDGGVQALKDKIADELRGARQHFSTSGQAYEREAAARAAAEDAEALERERPGAWDTMTEEQKDEHLDAIFGADSRPKPAAVGQETRARAPAPEVGPAEQAPGEREPGQDDEEVDADARRTSTDRVSASGQPSQAASGSGRDSGLEPDGRGRSGPAESSAKFELASQAPEDLKTKEKQAATGTAEARAAALRDRNDAILSPPEGTAPARDVAEQKVPTQQEGLFGAEKPKPAFSRQADNIDAYKLQRGEDKNGQPAFANGQVIIARGRPDPISRGEGVRSYQWTLYDRMKPGEKGGRYLKVGELYGDLTPDGKFEMLRSITIFNRFQGSGYGESVVASMLAHNGPGHRMGIENIQHHTLREQDNALPFWQKLGTRLHNYATDPNVEINGDLALSDYLRAREGKGTFFRDGQAQAAENQPPGRQEGAGGNARAREAGTEDRAGREAVPGRPDRATEAVGLTPSAVRQAIDPILSKWGNAPDVQVIASMAEAPEAVRQHDEGQRSQGASGAPEAFIYQNKVYLVAEGLASPAAAQRALLHESVGHFGLRGTLGERMDPVLDEVAKSAPERVRAKAKEYGLDFDKVGERRQAAEEVLAEIAQSRPTAGIVRRAIAAIRQFLRDIGFELKLSDSDIIAGIILPARGFVERAAKEPAGALAPAFSRAAAAPAPTYTVPSWAEGFDAAKKDALRKAGVIFHQDTLKDRARALTKDFGKTFVQGVVDQFAPLKDLDPIAYMKARLSRATDGGVEALLMYGKPFLRDGAIDVDARNGGFLKVLQGLKNEHDRFFAWVAGMRAGELKAKGKENLLTDEDLSFLRTLNRSDAAWSGRQEAYTEALRQLQTYNKAVLDIAEKQGIIDGESRPLWESQFYVPFYRAMEDGVAGPTVKSGLVRQYAFKKLKGGTQDLNDLTKNTLMNWSHLLSASQKNAAAKAAIDAAVRVGVAVEADEESARQMGKSIGNKRGVVNYLENGAQRWFVVDDPHILDAITSLEFAGFGPWMKPMAAFKRWLTFGVTANPAFKIRNLIRDSLAAIGQNPVSYNVFKNVAQGWKATEHSSQTRASLMAGGGMFRFGTILEGDRAQHLKELIESGVSEDTVLDTADKVKAFFRKTWDKYQEFGDRSENINRAALYEQLIKQGKDHLEASYLARDMLDFSMSGKWAAIRFLTQSVPFMNARLQGLYKLGRAVKEDPARAGYVTGAIALASLALLIGNEDDDDWKKREDWDRDTYWWFKFGGVAFRIPKPFELGAIGTIVERTYELAFNKEMSGKRYGQRMADILSQNFSMSPVPQLVKPLVDLYANQDSFSGRPIETMGMERLRKQDRYTEHTTYAARAIGMLGIPDPLQLMQGRYEGISPAQADFLIRGYFGWMGTMTSTAADYGIRPLAGAPEKPSMQLRDVFLAGNFVESLPTGSSRYVTDFYNQAKEIEQAYGSYREALKQGDVAKARDIFEAEREKIAKYKSVEAVKRIESQLTLKIHRVESSNAPPEDKRRLIDMLERQKDLAARRITAAH